MKNNKFIYNVNKKIFIIVIVMLIFVLISCLFIFKKNDGMKNEGVLNTYYRVYLKDKGWSKWTKNGMTAGNKIDEISNVQIKTKGVDKSTIELFNKKTWILSYNNTEKKSVTAIKFYNSYEFLNNYEMCYRVYNKKNKWLNWSCTNGGISGTEDESITAIQIKSIPKNVIYYEYLKNYSENINESFIGF